MAAVQAQKAQRLRPVDTAGAIGDLPGVIGLLGDSGFIYVDELSVRPEGLVQKLTSFGPPGFVLLASRVPDRLDAAMIAAGWTLRRTLEMMVLPRAPVPPTSPDDLSVVIEVVDDVNLGDVQPLSDFALGSRSRPSALVDHIDTHGYLARDHSGSVVAISAWSKAGAGAHIFNIATHPERRRQGLGSLMKLITIQNAYGVGAEFAYLEATTVGTGVYRRIGFRSIEIWRAFRHPCLSSQAI
jgi:ribosomal protein S18 acetylase RimI-like enzyme